MHTYEHLINVTLNTCTLMHTHIIVFCIFLSIYHCQLLPMFSILSNIQVFERERLNGHYGTSTYVIGNTFSAVPYLLLISLIPGAIAYYLPGLHKELNTSYTLLSCYLFA